MPALHPALRNLLLALWLALLPAALWASPGAGLGPQVRHHAEVALQADHAQVTPGQTLHLGLRLWHETGWHSYWANPGDSGLPTRLTWTLPAATTVSEIQWPAPQRKPLGELTNIGYSGDLLLPVELKIPADARIGDRIDIDLHARWLICAEICIPDEARLRIELPVAAQAQPAPTAARFAAALATVPRSMPDWAGNADRSEHGVEVEILGAAADLAGISGLEVFAKTPEVVANHRIDARLDADGVLRFVHPLSEFYSSMPAELDWVLVDQGREGPIRAWQVRLPALDLLGPEAVAPAEYPAESAPRWGLAGDAPASLPSPWLALLFALLGGILLNLMPCVFPVLALKALALGQGQQGHGQRRHALLYTAGVLLTFLLLAALLVALRATGEALGWGFQLQTPWFVAALALLMAAVGFALSGLATPGAGLMGLGQSFTEGGGDRAAFSTGVLAVVVASPCTAPFMGPALGLALTQPGGLTFAVFAALGLGLALPMLLLGFVPALARRLPRPGPWMERLKQGLAFPMYLTALWLAWVLGRQVGVDGMAMLVAGIVLLGFALWWRGALPGPAKRIASALLILLALAPVLLIARLDRGPQNAAGIGSTDTGGNPSTLWSPWSPERVAELRAQGRPVLVNFTAAWCISCIANERIALDGADFRSLLEETGAVYLKADWTDHDPRITAALAVHGRSGVPLYLLYPANGGPPEVLPQLLTPASVARALRQAMGQGEARP